MTKEISFLGIDVPDADRLDGMGLLELRGLLIWLKEVFWMDKFYRKAGYNSEYKTAFIQWMQCGKGNPWFVFRNAGFK